MLSLLVHLVSLALIRADQTPLLNNAVDAGHFCVSQPNNNMYLLS